MASLKSLYPPIKTLSVCARIQPGTEAALNTIRQKYASADTPFKPTQHIPLVRQFIASPFSHGELSKSLSIIASKKIPFKQGFFKPTYRKVPKGQDFQTCVKYHLDRSPAADLKASILYYNNSLMRTMSTRHAAQEVAGGKAIVSVEISPKNITPETAEEITRELLEAQEKPEGFVIDGLLLGDEEAVERGEEEWVVFPFATEETVVKLSEKGMELKKKNMEKAKANKANKSS